MKKTIFIITLLLPIFANAQILVEGSVGFGKVKGIQKGTTNFKPLTYEQQVGLFYRWAQAGFGIKSGVAYGTTNVEFDSSEKLAPKVLQIPAEFHFIANPKDKSSVYGVLGIAAKAPVGGDKAAFEKLSVAGVLGLGYQIKFGRIHLLPEVDYHFGVTNFTKSTFSTSNNTYNSSDDAVLNSLILKIGVGF